MTTKRISVIPEPIICSYCGNEIDRYQVARRLKPTPKYYRIWTRKGGSSSTSPLKYFDICSYSCLEEHQFSYFENEDLNDTYHIEVKYSPFPDIESHLRLLELDVNQKLRRNKYSGLFISSRI